MKKLYFKVKPSVKEGFFVVNLLTIVSGTNIIYYILVLIPNGGRYEYSRYKSAN